MASRTCLFFGALALAFTASACDGSMMAPSPDPGPSPPPIQGYSLELISAPPEGAELIKGTQIRYRFVFKYTCESCAPDHETGLTMGFLNENEANPPYFAPAAVASPRSLYGSSGQIELRATLTSQATATDTYFVKGELRTFGPYNVLYSQNFPKHYRWKTAGQ